MPRVSNKYLPRKVSTLTKLYALERKVKKNAAEVKYLDTNLNNVGSTTAGGLFTIFYISDIPQGPGNHQRIGDKIRILKAEIRGIASNPGVDLFLAKNKTGASQDSSMFALSSSGTFLEPNNFVTYHYELAGLKSPTAAFSFSKSFGTGLVNSYALPDGTSLQSNRLFFVLKNPFPATPVWVNASCRLTYTDA
jgi:hypothetical protein